jgi:hypothetical protein
MGLKKVKRRLRQRRVRQGWKNGRIPALSGLTGSRHVAQTSKSAVSQASSLQGVVKPVCLGTGPADLEIGDTADLEICATS